MPVIEQSLLKNLTIDVHRKNVRLVIRWHQLVEKNDFLKLSCQVFLEQLETFA